MTRSDIVLGVDFGASFSTAAVFVNGRFDFALDGRGEPCVPTAVHFPKRGQPITGMEAVRSRTSDPANTIVSFKRLLGAAYDSEERRFVDSVTALRLKKGRNGEILIKTVQGERSPVEVASLVIRALKDSAERRLGTRIVRAVMTAPARASQLTRSETELAGRMAGFKQIKLIPEPCAAALSFGLDGVAQDRRFLVYDFGGGTFDSSLIEQQGELFRVFGSDGDECLGGDNFDAELAKFLAGEIWRTSGVDVTKDRLLWDQTVQKSELAKRALSSQPATTVRFRDAGASQSLDGLTVNLHRDLVDNLWAELVHRSLERSARTVVNAGARPKELAGVMMVGGTTLVPVVRSRVKEVFAIPCAHREDAQTAVASGAALFAARRFQLSQDGWAT